MKIRPVGYELFHADRQTDRRRARYDKAKSSFLQFFLTCLKMLNFCTVHKHQPFL